MLVNFVGNFAQIDGLHISKFWNLYVGASDNSVLVVLLSTAESARQFVQFEISWKMVEATIN